MAATKKDGDLMRKLAQEGKAISKIAEEDFQGLDYWDVYLEVYGTGERSSQGIKKISYWLGGGYPMSGYWPVQILTATYNVELHYRVLDEKARKFSKTQSRTRRRRRCTYMAERKVVLSFLRYHPNGASPRTECVHFMPQKPDFFHIVRPGALNMESC